MIDPPNVEQVHDIEDRVLEDADGGSETEVNILLHSITIRSARIIIY